MTPREGSGSLSMQQVGYTTWCSKDAVVVGVLGVVVVMRKVTLVTVVAVVGGAVVVAVGGAVCVQCL